MNIARISVRRPVLTTMLMLMVIVLGLMSLSRLQIDLLPNIELPTITVRTQYDGADPVVMERLVTQIVEEIIATVPGVLEISSKSYEGNSSIRVSFEWGTNIDAAALDVRATLEDEISELPDDIVGPRVSKFDIDSYPVVILGISSQLDPVEFTQLIEQQIRYRFARIPGVAQVDPWGGFKRELRVELDPAKINSLGLPLNDITDAIKDANLDLPAGKIQKGKFEVTLRAPAEFDSINQIKNTVIAQRENGLITLGQIATIKDTYEKLTRIIRVNGKRGLRIAIRKQPEANTVEVAKRILAEIEESNQAFPQIHIAAVINQGNFIQRSITNVAQSMLYGGILAVLVLLFFLRNLRSTLVIALAIPISLVATFALLYYANFTLNLMTLAGLALGVGLMVDSSVVVLENIFRYYQEKKLKPSIAAVKGTSQVSSAVLAGTLTTLVIFLPLSFISGVSGILFKELGYVIMFSLLCALLVALSLVPMLASRLLLAPSDVNNNNWLSSLAAYSAEMFNSMEKNYYSFLNFILNYCWPVLFFSLIMFIGSLFLVPFLGSEFIPPSDEGEVRISGEMEVGTKLEIIDKQSKLLEKLVLDAVPEAKSSVVTISSSGTRGSSKAKSEIRLSLVPARDRNRSNKKIAADLRKLLNNKIPGMKIRTRAPQGQFLLERILKTEQGINIEIRGFDLDTLDLLSRQAFKQVENIAGITDLELDKDAAIPQQEIKIDRYKIADLGLTVRDVTEAIQIAIAGVKASEYRVDGNSYRILVQLEDAQQYSLQDVLQLTLRTPSGNQVMLRNLVNSQYGMGPVTIERKDQQRIVTLSANVAGRDPGSVAREMQTKIDQIPRPIGYELSIMGDFEEQQKAFNEMIVLFILALLLVYMVLASQYESFIDPLIVMSSVPLAAIGVVLTLFISNTTINLQSGIGCIMLVGIVVNNAILLVDLSNQFRRQGKNSNIAIAEAGKQRLRPILMTTFTTILALLPLALGIGEGADSQAPLARVVVGGLISSSLVTLVLIPVLYSIVHQD